MGGQNDQIYWINCFFRLFDFWTSCWEVKMIKFYIDFFRLFDFSTSNLAGRSKWLILLNILFFFTFPPLAGRSTERFYCIYCFFPTFRLFGLLPVGQNDWFYLVYCIFFTFRLLDLLVGGHDFTEYIFFFDFSNSWWERSKWSILLNLFDFFDISTSCWEVKLIDFTRNIDFFRLLDFSSFRPITGSSSWLILLNILMFFDYSAFWWEVKMIVFTEYWFFLTFLPLGGWSKWSFLPNIYWFFSTFRLFDLLGGGMINFTEYIDFFRLFDVSTSCWEIKMIDFTEYIGFFRLSTFQPLGGRSKWSNLLNIFNLREPAALAVGRPESSKL